VRPIAIGEAIVKIAEAVVFESVIEEAVEYLHPEQLAFDEAGCEKVIHKLRADFESGTPICSIDMTNAFNTVHREAIFAAASRFPKLMPIVHLLYGSPSTLLHRGGAILSEDGTRQGGVLSSLLFCLAIASPIKGLKLLCPEVQVRCIMDDISITGSAGMLSLCILHLRQELSRIGLQVNPAKCVILNCSNLASAMNFTHAAGAKILGAWIGPEESTRTFLAQQLGKTKPFFDMVTKLPPEIAIPVLTRCGIPRANYLLRTHPPPSTEGFAKEFDEMTLSALASILLIPRSQVSNDVALATHLPLTSGGVGMTSMSRVANIAYEASLAAYRGDDEYKQQARLTKSLNATLLNEASSQLRQHLRWGRNAGWIMSTQPNPHYRQCLLHHIAGHTGAPSRCHCGAKMTQRELASHALGCTRIHGTNASSRHREVKSAIIGFCNRNGIPVSDEPVVYNDGISSKRADLRITMPTEDVYVDVTVANAACKSYSSKSLATIERVKTAEKETSYLEHVARLNGHLVTFVAEARGSLASAATLFCKRLMSLSLLKSRNQSLVKEVQTALARTNGAILTNVLRPVLAFG
jgi:hypothetical protein